MYPCNCCRTCLSTQNLHPIFIIPEQSDKYTKAIHTATGVKVEINDNMPQEMCLNCINFINDSLKFRRICEEVQNMLLENKCNGIKLETSKFKTEDRNPSIDITDSYDDDFKDFDDNITLDTLQFHEVPIQNQTDSNEKIVVNTIENHEHVDSNEKIIAENEIDSKVIEIVENPILFNKKRKTRVKTVRKKEKRDESCSIKVKEEIECEFCHKILTSKLSLRNHYKIHTGFDIVCEHCGKKFITRRLLLMHCRAKHGYEKTDKCSYCDYRASNAEQVKIHERLHTGEKPFVCKTCSAGFHRKSSYLQHVAIHLPEKTVQCDQCPARFKSVTLMRIHKNRHRPSPYTFKCGVCNNSFARRRNVARHLQRVHGLTQDHHIHRIKIH
ncbi:zinc finger protein 845-like [Maniola jurtina]|uniref:zinc finger protein 845-like n=1 Tax=Maniola jurtina TaxID=191418 RepID=UPI001E68A480|nr:zinc finger protein 845-like [Maniola jurtina]